VVVELAEQVQAQDKSAVNQYLGKQQLMVVVVALDGKPPAFQEDQEAEPLTITAACQAGQQINQINHKAVRVLAIEAEIVSIVHLELTYGVAVVVALVLKVVMHSHSLDHHRALQAELEEQIVLMAQTGTGQVAVAVAHGLEVEAVTVVKAVAAAALAVLLEPAHLESTTVVLAKIADQMILIL